MSTGVIQCRIEILPPVLCRLGVEYLVEISPSIFFGLGAIPRDRSDGSNGSIAHRFASGLIKKLTTECLIVTSTIIFTYNPGEPKLQMAVTAMPLSRQ